MVTDPLGDWSSWCTALAPELRRELAIALGRLWPHLMAPDGVDPADDIGPRVEAQARTPLERVGAATMLVGLTELVLEERTDPASWAKTEDLLEVLGEASQLSSLETEDLGELIESFTEHARARAPLRERQWAREAERFRALRAERLSIPVLDQARRRAMQPPSIG